MPAAGPAKGQTPEFRPSQLVLCRYESYPYWPATINNMFPSEVKEGYRCRLDTDDGTFLFYWCMFCNEEKGGWVREDRIVLFHPNLVRYARVSLENTWYQEQQKAFRAAFKFYDALHSKALRPKPSDPIRDLLEVHRRGGDIGESDDEEFQQSNTDREEPKLEPTSDETVVDAKDEPLPQSNDSFLQGSSHHRETKKRLMQLGGHESEQQTPHRKQRTDNLQVTTSSPAALESLGEGAEVTFFAPPPPEEYEVVLPDRSTYNSRPASTASFSEMLTELRSRSDTYREYSKDAEEAHQIFDLEKENIRRKYKDLFERLRQVERRAADEKKNVVMLLQDILQARVNITDLKKHKAGERIKSLEKEYKSVPAIHKLCQEIVKEWTELVDVYVKHYRESL